MYLSSQKHLTTSRLFVQFISILVTIWSFYAVLVNGIYEESKLVKDLLADYDVLTRPVEKITDVTTIKVGMTLLQLINVNEKKQTITTSLRLRIEWDDFRMKWNPNDYANITMVRIPPRHLWIPDLILYNAASQDGRLLFEVGKWINVLIFNNYQMLWVPPMILESTCKMDVTWFPFDRQKCTFKFGSWTFNGGEINILLFGKDMGGMVDIADFTEHGAWKVINTNGRRIIKLHSCCPGPYYEIVFMIELQRRPSYYFFNLLVPCGLIGFLALLGFTLPPDSGEKLALGVTVLFSLIVFLNTITETMPTNSDSVPLIATYFNCVMLMIALSVVSTIVVNLNKRAMEPKEIRGLTRKILLFWLPRILRINSPSFQFTKRIPDLALAVSGKATWNEKPVPLKFDVKENSVKQMTWSVADQWKFAALVIDRLCLVISLAFIFLSVTIFLYFAY